MSSCERWDCNPNDAGSQRRTTQTGERDERPNETSQHRAASVAAGVAIAAVESRCHDAKEAAEQEASDEHTATLIRAAQSVQEREREPEQRKERKEHREHS